jgi:hypothetical protein
MQYADSWDYQEAQIMKVTPKMWLMIITASLALGAAAGAAVGLVSLSSLHPTTSTPSSQHK